MKARKVYFTAPRTIEVREETLPALRDDEALVQTVCSAISAGTEMLIYRGEFPHDVDLHDSISSGLDYPLTYGYASVGRIRNKSPSRQSPSINSSLRFGPYLHFIGYSSSIILLPEGVSPKPHAFPSMRLLSTSCRIRADFGGAR
jgi:hypothetical protein